MDLSKLNILTVKKLLLIRYHRNKISLFKVESWFLPHVKRWLIKTSASTMEWVDNAVTQDQVFIYVFIKLYSYTYLHNKQ